LRDWEAIPQQRLAQAEARMLDVANDVLARHGAAPLAWAADLFLGDVPLLTAWPVTDHYGRGDGDAEWIGPVFARGGGIAPKWPDGGGPRVFAYLKAEHGEHGRLLAALAQAGCRVLCYIPEVAGGKPPPVRAPGIFYARRPVDAAAALSETDWCVCHGGEATVAQAALAGVPLLLLPMQLEQFLLSRRMAAAGLAVMAASPAAASSPPDWQALLRRLLSDPAPRRAAQSFAARHAGYDPALAAARCVSRLVPA
jgi:hypothetical protein